MTTCYARWLISVGFAASVLAVFLAPLQAIQPNGPFENIKTAPLPATWEYSKDDGKTFAETPLVGPPPGTDPRRSRQQVYPYVWKGAFEVADPAELAGLWVRLVEDGQGDPKASICTGDLTAASGGYWKDLGFCPTLLNARLFLNGTELKLANGPLLYIWAPIQGPLKKGQNTIELRGNVYTYWQGKPSKTIDARLIGAKPQPANIYNGPVLGDFGEDYFSLACRTQLPADLLVEATPTEPSGTPVAVASEKSIWHRVKINVPKGTKKFTYTVTAKVGPYETRRGPFAVELPDTDNFRFVAFGNVMAHEYAVENWGNGARHILRARPAFLLNTGTPLEHGTWEFGWESKYIAPSGDLLATVPTFITPGSRDFSGVFHELHYTPGVGGYGHSWTKVIGPVRLIGIDGYQQWAAGTNNHKWLEETLTLAKEKFIFVLDGFPGYSSGKSSRHLNFFTKQTREVVLPLLGKYKASAMLCSWDPDYERVEPTPDKGCTQIVTGAIGKYAQRFSRALGANPFGPDKSKQWVGVGSTRHFCLFEVKGDAVEMRVLACPANVNSQDYRTIDKKTFQPRQ